MPAATAVPSPCHNCLADVRPGRLSAAGVCVRCARRRLKPPPPPPPWPTQHLPGTEGKLIVLEWRRENGYALWHTDDAIGGVASDQDCHPCTVREPRVYRVAAAG